MAAERDQALTAGLESPVTCSRVLGKEPNLREVQSLLIQNGHNHS